MGSGMIQYWINGPATGGIDDKIKMVNILLKTNIPSFHYSISGANSEVPKISIFSVDYRNSETFNYFRQRRDRHDAPGRIIFN